MNHKWDLSNGRTLKTAGVHIDEEWSVDELEKLIEDLVKNQTVWGNMKQTLAFGKPIISNREELAVDISTCEEYLNELVDDIADVRKMLVIVYDKEKLESRNGCFLTPIQNIMAFGDKAKLTREELLSLRFEDIREYAPAKKQLYFMWKAAAHDAERDNTSNTSAGHIKNVASIAMTKKLASLLSVPITEDGNTALDMMLGKLIERGVENPTGRAGKFILERITPKDINGEWMKEQYFYEMEKRREKDTVELDE